MNFVELNAILYYADFLSLQGKCCPVTDTCKYFFIHQCPINSAFIVDCQPIYDAENEYFIKAYNIYNKIKDKFGDDAVSSFIEDICSLKACGMVDAIRMLQHIHLYSSKFERNQAFLQYTKWKKDQIYTHQIVDEDGNTKERQCTKYFKHAEIASNRQKLHKSTQQIF